MTTASWTPAIRRRARSILVKLDRVAAHFDLAVAAPEIFQIAVVPPSAKVAGAIEAQRGIEGILAETGSGGLGSFQ
jgi:hypothetical protein